jgi:hypothetical protein
MSDTLHTVWANGALLGVRCHGCDHLAVLSPAELPTIRRGNTTRLRDLKLRCGHCGVRGQAPEQFGLFLPPDQEGGDRFLREVDVRGGGVRTSSHVAVMSQRHAATYQTPW